MERGGVVQSEVSVGQGGVEWGGEGRSEVRVGRGTDSGSKEGGAATLKAGRRKRFVKACTSENGGNTPS